MNNKKILIVEDDKMLCTIFDMFVKEIGLDITDTVDSGEKAIFSCSKNPPDIILMDIHLHGEINGIEASKYICENYFIPIIYITGDADLTTVKNAIQENTYGFLTKPVTREKLEISIMFALTKHDIIKKYIKNR